MQAEHDSNPEIYVKFGPEPSVCVSVDLGITLKEFKDLLYEIFDLEPENQKIVFRGRSLKQDEQFLQDAGIAPNETVYLLATDEQRYRERQRNALEHAANIPVSQVASEMGKKDALYEGSGMATLMKSMMRSPAIKEMLMRPEVMEGMLMNDPRIKKMVEKNPEMRKMLTSPETMKEMLEMMTNPDYQKHVQKSVDRALINLNAMPGGFDALKQVYSMQKPLFEDKLEPNSPQQSQQASSVDQLFTSESLPNPWDSKPATPKMVSMIPQPTQYHDGQSSTKGDHGRGTVNQTLSDQNLNSPAFQESAAELYRHQLQQLEEFGFLDREKNLQAIIKTKGNIDDAIDILIDEMENE